MKRIILILALSIFLQLLFLLIYWYPEPKKLVGDERVYHARARVINGEIKESSLPYTWRRECNLQPWHYPRFLSIFKNNIIVVQIIQGILLIASSLLWLMISSTIFKDNHFISTITFFLIAINIHLIGYSGMLLSEIIHLFWLTVLFWSLLHHSGEKGYIKILISGVSLGLCLLFKSLLSGFVIILLLWHLLTYKSVMKTLVMISVCIAILIPILISNFQKTGTVSQPNSSWFNIWIGLTEDNADPIVSPDLNEKFRICSGYYSQKRHTIEIPGEGVFEIPENAINVNVRNKWIQNHIKEVIQERGLYRIIVTQLKRQLPRLFHPNTLITAQLYGTGEFYYYQTKSKILTDSIRATSYILYYTLFFMFIVGILVLYKHYNQMFLLFLLFMAYNIMLFLILHVESRFRIQIEPIMAIIAGIGLFEIKQLFKHFFRI